MLVRTPIDTFRLGQTIMGLTMASRSHEALTPKSWKMLEAPYNQWI
jgi:hypothetical protein